VDKSKKQNSSFILFTIYIFFDVPKMPSLKCSWNPNYIPWKGERRKIWLGTVIPLLLNEQCYQCEAVVSNIKDKWIQMHTSMRSQFLSQLFLLPSNSTALDQPVFCKDVLYFEHLESIQIHRQWRY
jgi:hypothetical protein